MTSNQVKKQILKALKNKGIKAVLYYRAASGSIYIRFACKALGSIRIADHKGRDKYHYKWNLRADIENHHTETNNKGSQFFYAFTEIEDMAQHISNYYHKLPKKVQQDLRSKEDMKATIRPPRRSKQYIEFCKDHPTGNSFYDSDPTDWDEYERDNCAYSPEGY